MRQYGTFPRRGKLLCLLSRELLGQNSKHRAAQVRGYGLQGPPLASALLCLRAGATSALDGAALLRGKLLCSLPGGLFGQTSNWLVGEG